MPMCFINDHHSLNPHPLFIYWGLRFLKNHRKGGSRLPCTNGWMLLLIKSIILFCSPLNMKKNLFLMDLILCLSCIYWGNIVSKMLPKVGRLGKKIYKRNRHIGRLYIEGRFKFSAHCDL